jgi:hypothetical protein
MRRQLYLNGSRMSESVSGKRYLKREDVEGAVAAAANKAELTEVQKNEILILLEGVVTVLPNSEEQVISVKGLVAVLAGIFFAENTSLRPRDIELLVKTFSALTTFSIQ